MNTTTFQDGAEIPSTGEGHDHPIVLDQDFLRGSDAWDAQLLFFLLHG